MENTNGGYYIGARVLTRRHKRGEVVALNKDGTVQVRFSARYPEGLALRPGQIILEDNAPRTWTQDHRKHH